MTNVIKQTPRPDPLRRDLYMVQVFEDPPDDWVVVDMTRSRESALRTARGRLGRYTRRARIRHPRQHVVDFYVLLGNTIHD